MTGTLNLVGYGLSAIGPAIATGMIFAAYISGVARQPEARSVLQPIAFLGFALAEALALFGLVLAFVLYSSDLFKPEAIRENLEIGN
jgi:F-type H+-transporting ATPase subunit c